eukprot:TRINITY_DN8992_c0_g1_i2.p1 TRINITY_DN8992_c0_g1~~TRINITY_DN8992_c0_g1_i2.p1  ORF type:complete len:913 (-),score=145.48 TRINITY_DN8992_c0_g1_i2:270-3008(-)
MSTNAEIAPNGRIPSSTLLQIPKKSGAEIIRKRFKTADDARRGETDAEVWIVKKTHRAVHDTGVVFAIKERPVRKPDELSDSAYRELRILLQLKQLADQHKCFNFVKLEEFSKIKPPLAFFSPPGLPPDQQYLLFVLEYAERDLSSFKPETFTVRSLKMILFQIVYALYVAQADIHFVHNDFHIKNILINEQAYRHWVVRDGDDVWCLSGLFVKITDFGHSRMYLKGETVFNHKDTFHELYLQDEDLRRFCTYDLSKVKGLVTDWGDNDDRETLRHFSQAVQKGVRLYHLLRHPFFDELRRPTYPIDKADSMKDVTAFIASDGDRLRTERLFREGWQLPKVSDDVKVAVAEWQRSNKHRRPVIPDWDEERKRESKPVVAFFQGVSYSDEVDDKAIDFDFRKSTPSKRRPNETPTPPASVRRIPPRSEPTPPRREPKRLRLDSPQEPTATRAEPVVTGPARTLFKGLSFVLLSRGQPDQPEDDADETPDEARLHATIVAHGGRLLDATLLRRCKPATTRLISAEPVRSTVYMSALCLGVPCLHPCWIEDCCAAEAVLPAEDYALPAGYSLSRQAWYPQPPETIGLLRPPAPPLAFAREDSVDSDLPPTEDPVDVDGLTDVHQPPAPPAIDDECVPLSKLFVHQDGDALRFDLIGDGMSTRNPKTAKAKDKWKSVLGLSGGKVVDRFMTGQIPLNIVVHRGFRADDNNAELKGVRSKLNKLKDVTMVNKQWVYDSIVARRMADKADELYASTERPDLPNFQFRRPPRPVPHAGLNSASAVELHPTAEKVADIPPFSLSSLPGGVSVADPSDGFGPGFADRSAQFRDQQASDRVSLAREKTPRSATSSAVSSPLLGRRVDTAAPAGLSAHVRCSFPDFDPRGSVLSSSFPVVLNRDLFDCSVEVSNSEPDIVAQP